MKLSHLLPITAIAAGCSTTTVPPNAPIPTRQPSPAVAKPMDDCIAGVEVILQYPYGDGLTLQIERPDSCADRLGEFLHRQKLERRGQIVLSPGAKVPPGVRRRALEILVSRSERGDQEVYVDGKLEKGSTGKNILKRIEELERDGPIERDK